MFKKCKLKNLTWLKIGGYVNFSYAHNIEEIKLAIKIAQEKKSKFLTIGAGSNILATDNDIDAFVIKLGKDLNYIYLKNGLIYAGCAVLNADLAKFALNHQISGLEFFATIPGTIGGAIEMNAGSYGSDVSLCLDSVKTMDMNFEIKIIPVEAMGYSYRGHSLNQPHVFLEGRFITKIGHYDGIKEKIQKMIEIKNASQPVNARTCGSFFKNPDGRKAWQLIDDSGCRGMKIGEAQISTKHCNFFINIKNSTSNDMFSLYKTVQNKVKNCFNVMLEPEIIIIE